MAIQYRSLQQVIDSFSGEEALSPTQISQKLLKTPVIVHKYLKELLVHGKIKKVGLGTHVKYILTHPQKKSSLQSLQYLKLSYDDMEIIEQMFYKFAEDGHLLQGRNGFVDWCNQRKLDPQEKITQYLTVKKKIDKLKNHCGVIDATPVFTKSVEKMFLHYVYYADQYNRMEFGRGKLAEMTFYAKQSQNLDLINQTINMVKFKIECLVRDKHIDAIAIIPPSIVRKHQLLKQLKDHIKFLGLPFVNLIKYFPYKIPIPQKSLKTREQRVRNAQETIIVDDTYVGKYKTILLIDDFVGSGSTLNETAYKLRMAGAKKIIGFAFVGNTDLKYDVINEV